MVGHTHEDIDQMFKIQGCSRIYVYLCIHTELKEAVLNCDQQIIDVAELDVIWDIKLWLLPHINTPHGHTNPQNFVFQCGESGKGEMHYRNWSSDSWLPLPPQIWCGALEGQ